MLEREEMIIFKWFIKIIKFLFLTKVGRFILALLIFSSVASSIGNRAELYYNTHLADSTELKSVYESNPEYQRLKNKKHLTPFEKTYLNKAKQQGKMSYNGHTIGIIVAISVFVLGIILFILISRIFSKKKVTNNHTGKIFDDKEFKKMYNKNEWAFVIPTTIKKEKILLSNPFRGVFIQGGAGSGKSESLIIPIIKQCAEKNYSGIIYDFKNPELIKYAMQYYEESDIKVRLIDFKNPCNSERVNPLNVNFSISKIVDLSEALFFNLSPESLKNRNFFINEAINLFTGVMIYIRNNKPEYFTIPHVVSCIVYYDIEKVVKAAYSDIEARPYLASIHQSIEADASNQNAGVISTLVGNLAKLCNAENFYILSKADVDLNLNNPDNPTMLLIENDSTAPEVFNSLISCIITASVRNMNEENKHHSIIMLDEAPTIYVPKIEQIPATARSNKIVLMYACQDHSQNIAKYGNDNATTLLSNLNNQFFFRTINKNSAQLISDLFDRADMEYVSMSNSKTNSLIGSNGHSQTQGSSISMQERRRVKISDILDLNPGEFYGLIAEGNFREVLKKKALIDLDKEKPDFKIKPLTTQQEIKNNFSLIIEQAQEII